MLVCRHSVTCGIPVRSNVPCHIHGIADARRGAGCVDGTSGPAQRAPCASGARIACWGLAAANADPWLRRSGVRQPYFSSSCPLESARSLTAQVILPAAPLQSLAAMCSLPLSQRLPRINLNLRAATAGDRRTTRPPEPQGKTRAIRGLFQGLQILSAMTLGPAEAHNFASHSSFLREEQCRKS